MSFNWAFWGAVGIALGAAYLLWLFQRTMLGEVKEKNSAAEGSLLARDRGLRSADRLGVLDRLEPAAVLPGSGAAGGADRGARAPGYYAEHNLPNPLTAGSGKRSDKMLAVR